MRYWQFRDYVDQRGHNLIRQWLDEQPPAVHIKIDALIRNLETTEQLRGRSTKVLKGKCKGLIELRIEKNGIQYRPLAYYGPKQHQITILSGAIEKGDQFVPKAACDIALRHRDIVESDPTRSREHEF